MLSAGEEFEGYVVDGALGQGGYATVRLRRIKDPAMADLQPDPKAVVCTNTDLPAGVHDFESDDTKTKPLDTDPIKRVIYMDERIVPGSFYVEAVWVVGSIPRSHPEHCHEYDEVVGFVGSNMEDPTDLGGEIDFVFDGVKTTITKTCFIHVPAGVQHGGLCFQKDRSADLSDCHVQDACLLQCPTHIAIVLVGVVAQRSQCQTSPCFCSSLLTLARLPDNTLIFLDNFSHL